MSRFPHPFDLAARQAEHEDRVRRLLALGPLRYGNCCGDVAPSVVIDRDPGDEDDAKGAR